MGSTPESIDAGHSGRPGADGPASAAARAAESLVSLRRIVHEGKQDLVAVEEPLEIRVQGRPFVVTMRTPGDDEELAAGFLHGEGLITQAPEVGPTPDFAANVVEVRSALVGAVRERRFYATSSCGVCGKGALEEVSVHAPRLPEGPRCRREMLASLPEKLVQPGFARSGGLHATGIFDMHGELIHVYEDVGRHNAMDKAIGRALFDGLLPLHNHVLCVSGRLSFELVQKAAIAGAPFLVGVGAPSSLAIDLAADRRMTLCGFARGGSMNVYAGAERVTR